MYIVFEGPDGVGKSTICQYVKEFIVNKGYDVVLTRNPGATEFGNQIRDIVKYGSIDLDFKAERMLFAADNIQYIENILKPALKYGQVVICDRSNFISDCAYGYKNVDYIAQLHDLIDSPIIDILFVLTCDFETIKNRMLNDKERDKCKIESRGYDYLKNVLKQYYDIFCEGNSTIHKVASKRAKNIININAGFKIEDILNCVYNMIDMYISGKEINHEIE